MPTPTLPEILHTFAMESPGFSGVLSARDASGVLYEKAFGLRNRAENLPCETGTAFGIASGTKLFTALCTCRLVDAGRLTLDNTLGETLADYDLGTIDPAITIRQLLTHTSGVGDYIDEDADDSMNALAALYARYPAYLWEDLAYYLPMSNALPAKFAPGARVSYANTGYVLLGLCIEKAGGMRYQDYVTQTLIRPLGLAHTGFYRMDELPANTALGYYEEAGHVRANIFRLPVIGGADGGLFTCAADMDALWRALCGGRLLSPAMQQAFFAPQAPPVRARWRILRLRPGRVPL